MDGDDIAVGNTPPIRKPSQIIIRRLRAPTGAFGSRAAKPSLPKTDRPAVCGEMSQQRGHNDAQSTPQKFLRLVGCYDPKARSSVKR